MIQRIQTLYLLGIVILSGFVIFAPLADLVNTVDKLIYLVDYKGISLLKPTGNTVESTIWGLTTISMIVPVIALIAILSYKNRTKQIRLCVINMVFMLAFYGCIPHLYRFICSSRYFSRVVSGYHGHNCHDELSISTGYGTEG